MKQSYLITGANGFIGSNFVRSLVQKGEDVTILSRKGLGWRLASLEGEIKVLACDIASDGLAENILRLKPAYVFHFAAFGAMPSEEDEKEMFRVNVNGLLNILNSLNPSFCKKIIIAGSSSEYGIHNQSMKEDDRSDPINMYGVSKLAATNAALLHSKKEGLNLSVARLFSPFGPFEDKNRLIPYVIMNALKDNDIVVGSDSNVRDYIYMDDVLSAFSVIENSKKSNGQIYNIGRGVQYSTKEIINTIVNLTGSKSKILYNKRKNQARQIEPKIWRANTLKLKSIGWKPMDSISSSLTKDIWWFKKNIGLYEQ